MKNIKYSLQIAKGAIISFLGMIFGRGLTYLYIILLARLGSSKYGLISLGLATTLFLTTITMLGLKTVIVRYISFYQAKRNKGKIKGTILSSIKISLPISIIFTILLFLFSDKISLIIFHNAELIPILKLFSLTIPFIVLSNIFLQVILSYRKIEYQVRIKEIIENVVKLALTFLAIYFGYNLFGVVVAYIIAIILTFFLSFYFMQKKCFNILDRKIKTSSFSAELLKISFPLFFADIFTLIIKWMDVFLLGFFRSTSEVGIYNVVLSTSSLLVLVPTGIMVLFLPIITRLYSQNNKKEIKEVTVRTSKWIFFANFPIFMILLLFSKQILRIMFGNEYVIGYTALLVLIFAFLLHSITHVNSSILIMLRKTKIILFVGIIITLSNIILNLLLIPKYGILGGAIAMSASLIINYIIYSILVYKITKIFTNWIIYLKFIVSGILSFLVIYLIKTKIEISSISLIALFLLFIFIYFILSILFKSFDEQDKSIFIVMKNRLYKMLKTRF